MNTSTSLPPSRRGPTTIFVVRHANPVSTGLCYGKSEIPVTPDAESAANLVLSEWPDGIEKIFASPSRRAQSLGHAIGAITHLPVHIDRRLCELDFGDWEKRSWDDIYTNDRDRLDRFASSPLLERPPRGESGLELIARVYAFTQAIDCTRPLLVTHAGPIRALRALAALSPKKRHPQAITRLDFDCAVPHLCVETMAWEGK
jgi:alpha-ribazole phosphatase